MGEARFATADADQLLGAGTFSSRGLAIVSARFGTFSPHLNTGFAFRRGQLQNNAVLGTFGFDDLIADYVTLAADLVSEMQVGHSKLQLPQPVHYDYPFSRTIDPTSIPDIADNIVNGSLGFKFVLPQGFTLVTNALVPLNRGGLRANSTVTLGVEFAF